MGGQGAPRAAPAASPAGELAGGCRVAPGMPPTPELPQVRPAWAAGAGRRPSRGRPRFQGKKHTPKAAHRQGGTQPTHRDEHKLRDVLGAQAAGRLGGGAHAVGGLAGGRIARVGARGCRWGGGAQAVRPRVEAAGGCHRSPPPQVTAPAAVGGFVCLLPGRTCGACQQEGRQQRQGAPHGGGDGGGGSGWSGPGAGACSARGSIATGAGSLL